MDTPSRRSGIPVPTAKTSSLKKIFSKSSDDLLADDFHNHSGDLDAFTLLEENIALKERTENLTTKSNAIIQKNVQLERENARLGKQLNDLKVQQKLLKDQLQSLMEKFQKEMQEGQTIHNIQEQQKKIINELMLKVRAQDERHIELLRAGKQAKHKLEELAPEIGLTSKDDSNKCDIVTAETVEQLISEIGKIKTQMNSTELQLYEANEKIAELIENHQNLKDENEMLKVENLNLTKVAKLMTNSMKESMDTSKRMEEALMEMKKRNDELVRSSKDAIDSPTSPKFYSTNDQVIQLKDELKRREAAHTERIVEMNKLMETTIETNNSDEINVLRIKLEVVEKELQLAISRAEKAENDLEQIKSLYKTNSSNRNTSIATTTISSNEPPTVCCLICNSTIEPKASTSSLTSITTSPPPPPPMPNFKLPTVNFTKSSIVSLSDGIEAFALNNMRQVDTDENSLSKKPATGMDALIAELRDGAVTLRRNRRKTATNAALQEMFATLELSRKHNRNSRIIVESHMPKGN